MSLPDKPLTRQEQYLSKIAGEDTELPEKPLTREEQYLEVIANNGGGGGTSDFDQLSNRPSYNGVAMTSATNIPEVQSYSDFVGTDGQTAGTHGLVPAPATTDADKFLKSDGTWATAGGGGSQIGGTILTSEMYNYPAENPNGVALWLLPAGVYYLASDDNTTKVYRNNTWSHVGSDEYSTYFVSQEYGGAKLILLVHPYSGTVNPTTRSYVNFEWYRVDAVSGVQNTSWFEPNSRQALLTNSDVKDSLTSTAQWVPLSANQGKVLKDLIDALDARVTALEGGNANQNSSSSADPGAFEPDPGVIAPTVTCPFCGQQTSADSTICQFCGNDISGGAMPDPEEPIAPEEPTEEPVEG